MANDLDRYFEAREDVIEIQKSANFRIIYDQLLSKYRNKDIVLVEVGIGNGGSLQIWEDYLGKKAKIIGIDIVDRSNLNTGQITCIIGDQSDRNFLNTLIKELPDIDVFIDDASHNTADQIVTFEAMFSKVISGGLYVVEDTHTSYRPTYGGGYLNPLSFIEYCKRIIDCLHYAEDEQIPKNGIWHLVDSITFYRSMVVLRRL